MFGRQSLGSGGGSSGSNLVEFRAGRMNLIGKMVHPDTRKGLVYLTQSEDGLMHFCWKDRTSGKVEDDLIVFPDDFEFKRVEQCKTGRVYVLKFKSSSRRMFFWMQEPKTDKDEEHCRRVNELMNNPPSASRGGQDGGDLQYMLNNMSQQQLMQLFGGVGQMGGLSSLLGSMNRSSDSTRTPSSNRNSSSNAAGLVTPENSSAPRTPSAPKANKNKSSSSTGGTSSETGAAASASATGAGAGRTLNIDLSTALTGSEAVNDLISDPERVNSLSVHLPETEDADENKKQQIKDTIASPQFQQALSLFSSALGSAQLGPVVSQFELSPEAVAAAYSGNLEDFVKALEKALPAGATMSPTSTKGKDTTEVKKEESNESAEKKE
ncbi:proteasomal ubiquitin receptor ADRM1 homolog isoform X2 [Stomoxys calcitrans]|uniref:Proteasomal ubiquitin receptor ADRM1 homolog n=1 Tax=Stomoxys calcitrans TaxID=35570 RepID=A0A1I8PHP7_STOCA|nr:proteasomal ubiquitin receptor ADRM1 homolog isoform X2 [Stomoxys calcitrans]